MRTKAEAGEIPNLKSQIPNKSKIKNTNPSPFILQPHGTDAMTLKHTLNQMAGSAAAWGIRGYMSTLDYRVAYYDPSVDPARPEFDGNKIFCFWHEHILFPFYLRSHNNMAMLLSKHRDADVLSETARRMGFDLVRGSTFRGGSTAIRELIAKSRDTNLTITPDGPRGPRRAMAQGPVYLSSKIGRPLVLAGFGYSRAYRAPTWDQFAIPLPFCRARAVLSPPIQIPPDLDRTGLETYRVQMEQLLNRLTCEAEAWAESGTHKVNEQPLRRASSHRKRRFDRPHPVPRPAHDRVRATAS
jgi:lysophospholipid acyltransferase (LPLAT)-like uncharacterized protein